MRLLFGVCSVCIIFVYYIGASRVMKNTEAFNQGLISTMYALTGRNAEGQFIETTIEEVEEESPYYFPDAPKDSEQDMRYYA